MGIQTTFGGSTPPNNGSRVLSRSWVNIVYVGWGIESEPLGLRWGEKWSDRFPIRARVAASGKLSFELSAEVIRFKGALKAILTHTWIN